ncbi:molybdopterin molybdotransferase MoeA, partial [Selenomonas sp.]|uniref:molybdopterin molybdotransferase MoeA n=1 Tax=Selenomonas sp. TaxID=2053611 RepID=UPI003FA3097F
MQDISLEKAQELLLREVREIPLSETESVPLLAALGRRLAEDRCAAFDQPPFDRSPLDGYALLAACTQGASADAPARFRVIGEECAGSFFAGKVGAGEALRLMTGAAMPEGADTVVRQEDVRVEGEEILVPYALKHHENFCFRGEDVEKGAVLAKAGDRLTAAHIAVLAGQGMKRLPCVRRARIVLASTGDELVEPGEPLCPGKIYNSNLYLLAARLKEMGFEAEILGALPDDAEAVARALVSSAEPPDLVLTTGGVSVGKKDIMHDV